MVGDLTTAFALRRAGGLANALALAAFVLVAVVTIVARRWRAVEITT